MQTSKKEFHKDKSIIYHQYYTQPPIWDIQYKVGYLDLRGNHKEVILPVENEEPNYEDFLQQKALQHCKDYNEYVSVRELSSLSSLKIKTETTYGTDPKPVDYTKAATYQKGDKFILDEYTCVVTDVEKKRNYYIKEISYGHSPSFALLRKGLWVIKVKKFLTRVQGSIEEEYYLKSEETPRLENYKTNEDWYDALIEVVNKK